MNDLNIGMLPTAAAVHEVLLGRLAQNLDLTQTQYDAAKSAYDSVAGVLAADSRAPLRGSKVFPQGSFALGTVVKPLTGDGFDVDLICRLASSNLAAPAHAKSLIGSCLGADGRYKDRLEEKSRCWRLVYANEFHLDVAPVVPSTQGGDWIPDRELRQWIATHPEAFASWFNQLADLAQPQLLLEGRVLAKADVIPFPDSAKKGWLRRLVQLLKRHRDVWQQSLSPDLKDHAPISIIITTLAAYAFANVRQRQFKTSIELLQAIIADMPNHVRQRYDANSRLVWWIQSPVANENFANRWNENPVWAECFFAWCNDVAEFFVGFQRVNGLNESIGNLRKAFGDAAASGVAKEYAESMREAREAGQLRMTPAGLAATSAAIGSPVRAHTFYGDG